MVKEANTAVSTQQTSQDNPLAGFGPNEWIVEEMYQRYLADPASVDPAWHDFFADYKPAMAAGSIATPDEATARQRDRPPRPRPAPTPRPPARSPRSKPTVAGRTAAAPAAQPAAGQARAGRAEPSRAAKPAANGKAAGAAPKTTTLRGVAARIVQNMDASLRCRPRPACARSRPSCWSTTAS